MKPTTTPHLNDFFIKGIPLATALELLSRWEAVDEEELVSVGFIALEASATHELAPLALPRSELN
jgi:hypothetical protein